MRLDTDPLVQPLGNVSALQRFSMLPYEEPAPSLHELREDIVAVSCWNRITVDLLLPRAVESRYGPSLRRDALRGQSGSGSPGTQGSRRIRE